MPANVQVKVDTRKLVGFFSELKKRNLSFAASRGINNTAFRVKKDFEAHIKNRLTLRREGWIKSGVRVVKSNKRNLTAIVGHRDDYMVKQNEGGTVKPKRKHIAVPAKIRTSVKELVPRSKYPRKILNRKVGGNRPFLLKKGRRTLGIAVRTHHSGKRYPLDILYAFYKKASYKKTIDLGRVAELTASRYLQRDIAKALDKAVEDSIQRYGGK